MSSSFSTTTATVSLSIVSCVLAGYLTLTVLAGVLYLGRRSYRTCCTMLPCQGRKQQLTTKGTAPGQDTTQRWWLDMLVSSILVVVLLRTFSQFCSVFTYARQVSLKTTTPVLDSISISVTLVSIISYSLVFNVLIWLWLRLSMTFFEESEAKKKCIIWTLKLTSWACILSAVLSAIGMVVLVSIPGLYQSYPAIFIAIFATCAVLYSGTMLALCIVVIVLGVRIMVMIKRTTAPSEPGGGDDYKGRRGSLIKISGAVAAFLVSQAVRTGGAVLLSVNTVVPSAASMLLFIDLPEFITFGALVVILWPFTIRCGCHRSQENKEPKQQEAKSQELVATVLPAAEAPCSPVASPQVFMEAEEVAAESFV